MIRETSIYLSRLHKDALRIAATVSGRSCPDEQLEVVLEQWLERQPQFKQYVQEKARLEAVLDKEARKLAGLTETAPGEAGRED